MNKLRRKGIRTNITKLHELIQIIKEMGLSDIEDKLADIIEDLEYFLSEEECYRDNMPENLQNGFKYERAEEACDNLQDAVDTLAYIDSDDTVEDVINNINEAVNCLYNAI